MQKERKSSEVKTAETIDPPKVIRLNLGCGFRKEEGYVNIDNREEVKPDLVHNVEKGLPFEDSTVDEVKTFDFLEHIRPDKVIFVLSEIHRVLKKTGFLIFRIPSTDGRGWAQDPTHRSYWNINSWLYYVNPDWHALYPTHPRFREDVEMRIHDVCLNEQLRIIHTEGKVYPVK